MRAAAGLTFQGNQQFVIQTVKFTIVIRDEVTGNPQFKKAFAIPDELRLVIVNRFPSSGFGISGIEI
jgi:hypothetical protein